MQRFRKLLMPNRPLRCFAMGYWANKRPLINGNYRPIPCTQAWLYMKKCSCLPNWSPITGEIFCLHVILLFQLSSCPLYWWLLIILGMSYETSHGISTQILQIAYRSILQLQIPQSHYYKNIVRHTAHTIVSWPNPKQWLMINTSGLMMIIRESTHSHDHHRTRVSWRHTAPYIG